MIEKLIDRITRASLRFKWVTIFLSVLIMAAGIIAMSQLNQELLPKIEFPQSVVLALNPGEEAEDVLNEVTIPIEDAVSAVEGVVNVESTTSRGLSVVIVRNEFGMDQDVVQEDIQVAIESVDYPEGMETPELLTFSLSDLPLAAVSVSSPDLTLDELKEVVEKEVMPSLDGIEGVARVEVSGGQALPEEVEAIAEVVVIEEPTLEPTATSEPTATPTTEPTATPEPTAVPTETPAPPSESESVALSDAWVEAAAAQGMEIATTADLTPEIVGGIASFAPEMLQELTPEMLLVMPLDALAALPQEYLAALDPELQGQLAERAAAAMAGGEETEPVALPDTWVEAAAAQGMEIATTSDLTPEIVGGIASFAPEMLQELTPEMLLAMPLDALAALPQEYLAALDPELQGQLAERAAAADGEEEIAQVVEPEPVALPEAWIGAAAAQGMEIATTADLTPEIVGGIASFAPEMLQELTPEMLLAMPLDALAALPQEYLAELDPELQAQLAERAAAAPSEPTDETSVAAGDGIPLPDAWIQGAAAQGLEIATTADLTPELVAGIAGFAPQFLAELTPEMLLSMSPEALAALPEEFLLTLDEDLQAQLGELIAQAPQPEEPADPGDLPASWQAAAQAQNVEMTHATDVTPEMIQALSNLAPQMLNDLTPDNLRLFSPEALSWLPPDYVETLDAELVAELEELAAPAGGLSAAFIAAEEEAAALSAGAPVLPESWTNPPEDSSGPGPTFETAADIINSGFADTGAEFLSMFVASGRPTAPTMIGDLTPEVVAWLNANEEGFLTNLDAGVLRLLAPETISSLPEEFMASLEAELRTELEGIAAGTVTVFVPEQTITRVDGNPGLTLTVFKDGEANTVSVSHAVFEKLDEIEADNGLNFDVAFEQASFIEESVSGVAREGALGALFAVIIILIFLSGRNRGGKFLWSWRSTLVIAVSIPLSVMMAFAALRWLPLVANPILDPLVSATADIPVLGSLVLLMRRLFPVESTLNLMTLSGMTVAIGRVVDDSIVVLENIYRHIQRGEDRKQAVLVGTRDVAIAILASTITTVVVFMPIGLLGGIVGSFFLPFGVTVTYALLSSFLVAVTIVPLLAFLFIRKEHLPPERETNVQRRYVGVLNWALDHRALTLVIAGVIFAGSIFLMGQLPRAFLPEMGEVQVTAMIELPGETSMVETNEMVLAFEEAIGGIDGLDTMVTEIGSTGGIQAQLLGGSITQYSANVAMGLEPGADLDALTAAVRAEAESVFGVEHVTVSGGTLASSAFGSFALVLSGDTAELTAVNDEVIATLEEVDGLVNVSSNLGDDETLLRVDRETAVRFMGELETDDSLGVIEAAKEVVTGVVPATVSVSEGFESEQQTEGFAQASQAILISIVAVYVVMVFTFNSFVHPFTILFSLPLAIIGAALALWASNRVLGLSSMIGLMMLVGIVVTNAIVLIDRVQANRKKRGMSVRDSLVEGGATRLRPILMTALAAMMALLPLAIGLNEGAIIAAELGTVVIGGLFTSTLLTLLVVPVMFSLLNRLTRTGRAEAKQAAGE